MAKEKATNDGRRTGIIHQGEALYTSSFEIGEFSAPHLLKPRKVDVSLGM